MGKFSNYLKFLRGFFRHDCPEEHYRAWKIVVLGTDEYDGDINQVTETVSLSFKMWLEEGASDG